MTSAFQPIGALADAQAMSLAPRCGRASVAIVTWLRDQGGVRTLREIRDGLEVPIPELEQTLAKLDDAGLVHHRDMTLDHGTERVWYALRAVIRTPENASWI
ncbi:hypothetical protein [Pararhodobacter sp. CCB-MM2]|uniref:hypothetical protein n=1 Tax=Pararhodobacter sp. CCB-MM2 TaxID=1786003 RepID=UPI0008365FB0|nr:hypothetical protein [Pararhodobacter sp. CCB-MM2]